MKLYYLVASSLTFVVTAVAAAEPSPLCTDLARYACSPGDHKDPTGVTRSQSEMSKFMTGYAEKTRQRFADKFAKILDDPENEYFKDLTLAAFGLKNSPECTSKDQSDRQDCRAQLLEGLTAHAAKLTVGTLEPKALENQAISLPELMHVTSNSTFASVINEFNGQAEKDLVSPEQTAKIKDKIFPQVKQLIVERIAKSSASDEQKRLMISKVKSIKFAGSKCEALASGMPSQGPALASLLVSNAFYDPASNNFTYCSGFMLQSSSEFQIAFIIAHEIGHSIDPCQLASGPSDLGFKYKPATSGATIESQHPFGNVTRCLRDPGSVSARKLTVPPPMPPIVLTGAGTPMPMPLPGGGGGGDYGNYTNYPTTNQSSQIPPFCQNDQLPEAFADWIGSEVLPEYIDKNHKLTPTQYQQGYGNALRTGCWLGGSGQIFGDTHPATAERINKLLLTQPKIRAQMGCPPNHPTSIYCDADRAPAEPEDPTQQRLEMKNLMNLIEKNGTGVAR